MTEVLSSQNSETQKPLRSHFTLQRFLIGFIIAIVILLIPLMLFRLQQEADVLLVTVGDKKIYKSSVEQIAKEQYVSSAVTKEVLENFLHIAVERAILYREAEKLGIIVSDKEVNDYLDKKKLPEKSKLLAKYSLLEDKVVASQVKNVEAYVVGFWIPPYSYPQKPEFALQRQAGEKALAEIEKAFNEGHTASEAAQVAYKNYPILQNILAVNGYLLRTIKDDALLSKPKVYVFNKEDTGQAFYDALFSIKKSGDVKKVMGEDGSGGSVIKSVTIHSGMESGYIGWLNERKKELVTVHNTIQ